MSDKRDYSKEIEEILKKHLVPNHMSSEFFEHKRQGVESIVDAIKLAVEELTNPINIGNMSDENISLFKENKELTKRLEDELERIDFYQKWIEGTTNFMKNMIENKTYTKII